MKTKRFLALSFSLIMIFSTLLMSVIPLNALDLIEGGEIEETTVSGSNCIDLVNNPGTTFVLEHDFTSEVCDLWNEIDSEGSGDLAFKQSFSVNINDAIDAYNNYLDTEYPNGERDHYKASDDIHNGSIFYVEARILINDYDFIFSNEAGYMLAPYGLDGNKRENCGKWYLRSSSVSTPISEEIFKMSIDSTGKILNFSLDGTVKEFYNALKAEDEELANVTIDNLSFEVRASCQVEYRGYWGNINYTELSFEALSHSLYDKHIYGSTSEYDIFPAIPVTSPITVNVGPAYDGCYEPVKTEYRWYYEFIKEGYDTDEDDNWYGYFEKDESKESDVLTETAPSGALFGVAYGTIDSGDKNYITINDILNENNKEFINSFIGVRSMEFGGNGQMFIECTVTLTFADGKQYELFVTKADYSSWLVAPCLHACTVCGYCTVKEKILPCNFDQMIYDIGVVCICDEPSIPDYELTVEAENQMTIESTGTTVNVIVEKIKVDETPTNAFIINATSEIGANNVLALYNISIFDEEGYPYSLNRWGDMGEELTVSIPISVETALAIQGGDAVLYHVLANGTPEKVENVTVEINEGSAVMIFTSDSFSPFVLAGTVEPEPTPDVPEVKEGFVTEDGKLYFYENNVKVKYWFEYEGKTYYASGATNVVINYSKTIGGKYYLWNDETGLEIADGFVTDENGTKCYENGINVIGWRHADGSGPKVVNGISEQYSSNPEGLYYFLSTTGYMVTESTYKLGGYIREFNDDHTVKAMNGLQTNGGELYYYVDGVKQTGWHTIDGTTYYFRASDAVYGRAATKWMYIGNKVYYFYASTSATPYALKDSGKIGGIEYTYHEDGYILYNGFVNCDYANAANSNTAANIQKMNGTTRYYKNGEMQTGWQQINGNWYYFYAIGSANGSGYMCVQSRTIGGVWYEFTETGVCTNK